jgi:microcystin-dependent protein
VSQPFIGEIRLFGFNFAPRGWAPCQGQLLSIAQNTALFALLGTMYGGNGQTTFALPDLRGRFPMSFGQGAGLTNRTQGEMSGTETVTLTQGQMPPHNHPLRSTNQPSGTTRPAGNYPAGGGAYAAAADGTMAPDVVNVAGGGQPHDNIPPYLVLNYCIALEGIFPSRN